MPMLTAFIFGTFFSLGLAVSGMVRPSKVIGFLDFAGKWDPTLAFVMGGALLIFAPAFLAAKRRQRPLVESKFDFPTRREVTPSLLAGAALFGIGWGVSGFCPGAAIAAMPALDLNVVGALLGMTAGVLGMRALRRSLESKANPEPVASAADF